MNEIFRQEFYYLKQIFQSSRIQKFKGNNWEKAFLVLTLYLLILQSNLHYHLHYLHIELAVSSLIIKLVNTLFGQVLHSP